MSEYIELAERKGEFTHVSVDVVYMRYMLAFELIVQLARAYDDGGGFCCSGRTETARLCEARRNNRKKCEALEQHAAKEIVEKKGLGWELASKLIQSGKVQ